MKKRPLLTNDLASTVRPVAKLQIILPPKDMTFDFWRKTDGSRVEKSKTDSHLADKMFGGVCKIYQVATSHLNPCQKAMRRKSGLAVVKKTAIREVDVKKPGWTGTVEKRIVLGAAFTDLAGIAFDRVLAQEI